MFNNCVFFGCGCKTAYTPKKLSFWKITRFLIDAFGIGSTIFQMFC